MPRRTDTVVLVALVVALAGGAGCAAKQPPTQAAQVGHHRVRFVLPAGWEHLDHGREQQFRLGEAQVSLKDLGPATREAMADELRAAERLWRDGHRRDAFERVRQLRGPALRLAESRQRADFWKPWTDVTYVPEAADSFAIGPAFEALISGTGTLPEVTPQRLLEYVLALATDMRRREVAQKTVRTIHGAEWTEVETWDTVSHMNRSRLAYVESGGYLLVMTIDRGVYEQVAPGFDALLASLELEGGAPAESGPGVSAPRP